MITKIARNIITTGCRGVPKPHHEIVKLKKFQRSEHGEESFSENYDYNCRYHKYAYNPNNTLVHLMLYDGPILDINQEKSSEDTLEWENFFSRVLYQDSIHREYLDIVGLPHGVVYNARTNEIRRFDDHYKLHEYFMKIY